MMKKLFAAVLFVVMMVGAASADSDYSSTISSKIKKFLDDDDWHYSFDSSKGRFAFGLSLKGELKSLEYTILVHSKGYTVYAVSPVKANLDSSTIARRMLEFICRANYGLRNGNFEMDMRDGEVRYKTYVNCNKLTPSQEVVSSSIYVPANMFKRYAPGMFDVMFRDSDSKKAVEKCEADL